MIEEKDAADRLAEVVVDMHLKITEMHQIMVGLASAVHDLQTNPGKLTDLIMQGMSRR